MTTLQERPGVSRRRSLVTALLAAPAVAAAIGDALAREDVATVAGEQIVLPAVDPALLAAVIYEESRFRDQTSHAGARGLMQITPATADTIEDLADKLEIDRAGLVRTVQEFNAAVNDRPFNPAIKDGKCTRGIQPPKSNWAQRLDTPPYVGYAVTCGITFTFGGLRINERAQVLNTEGSPIPGLYAAGELVGGLFYYNYPGGAGLMAGAVFGRLAGGEAGRFAAEQRGR